MATTSAGKLAEVRRLLPDWSVLGFRELAAAGNDPEGWSEPLSSLVESGSTFFENARLKALHASRHSPLLVLADDSGLCIDALGGAPGVLSARHGGPGLDDRMRNELVLREMQGVPDILRGCHYRAALVLARAGVMIAVHEGACSGRIAHAPSGTGGFGYDPIVLVPPFERTMAELDAGEKDAISHRARAMAGVAITLEQVEA